jgi:Icc-related predicted phosphoesterase
MKIQLLSDLHLSMHGLAATHTDADVVVLAGDLGRPAAALAWASQFNQPTLLLAGNHEFYGSDLQTTMALLRDGARRTNVQVLECDEWHLGNVRFLGCTLWSDHRLLPAGPERERGLQMACEMVRDFSRIAAAPGRPEPFTPALAQQRFDASVAWLDACFARPHDGPTVVVTHFAPTRHSIHPRFAGSPLNACFVSDLQARIESWQPQLWLHGHTHDSFDYRIGATRVLANPRGYAPAGVVENAAFDPGFVVELAQSTAAMPRR